MRANVYVQESPGWSTPCQPRGSLRSQCISESRLRRRLTTLAHRKAETALSAVPPSPSSGETSSTKQGFPPRSRAISTDDIKYQYQRFNIQRIDLERTQCLYLSRYPSPSSCLAGSGAASACSQEWPGSILQLASPPSSPPRSASPIPIIYIPRQGTQSVKATMSPSASTEYRVLFKKRTLVDTGERSVDSPILNESIVEVLDGPMTCNMTLPEHHRFMTSISCSAISNSGSRELVKSPCIQQKIKGIFGGDYYLHIA